MKPNPETQDELTAPLRLVHREPRPRRLRISPDRVPLGETAGPRILLLEDDTALREVLVDVLVDAGYEVVTADCRDAVVDRVIRGEPLDEDQVFDLILSDIRMPGRTGLEVLEELRYFDFLQPVILITGFGDNETREEALRLGATLLDKPFEMPELLAAIEDLCPRDPPPAVGVAERAA